MSTIITPTHAIFKEGEVYVYTLPEEPRSRDFNRHVHEGFEAHRHAKQKYKQACAYARAHAIKVDEKDKEIVEHLIWDKIDFHSEHESLNWVPQDLAEYKLEGVRMEIRDQIRDNESKYFLKDRWYDVGKRICPTVKPEYRQIACLIEDDGVKEETQNDLWKEFWIYYRTHTQRQCKNKFKIQKI